MNLMELDCHLSLDGEVVIAHDADLERMCGEEFAGKMIKETNYADLPLFKKEGIKMHLSAGDYIMKDSEDGKFSLLRDLFAADKDSSMLYSIDMKHASNEIMAKVNGLIKEYKMENRCIWGSMFAD